jgi:hypothetical protein
MAWTASKYVKPEAYQVRVLKGNGLQEIVTEEHGQAQFQAKLCDGMDINKAIFVRRQVAALGARGDELWLRVPVNNDTAGAGDIAPIVNKVFAQITDYSGVPVAVQHAVMGKYSPFVTPSQPVNDSMLDGIDIQQIDIADNVCDALDATCAEQTQKVHGSADTRFKAGYYDGDDAINVDPCAQDGYYAIRCIPNSDEVFVLKRGSIIWLMPDAGDDDAFGETTT